MSKITIRYLRSPLLAVIMLLGSAIAPEDVLAEASSQLPSGGKYISARIKGVRLREAADQIERATGARFHWMADQGEEQVDVEFGTLPLIDGIRRLVGSRNNTVLSGSDGNARVWIGSPVSKPSTATGTPESGHPEPHPYSDDRNFWVPTAVETSESGSSISSASDGSADPSLSDSVGGEGESGGDPASAEPLSAPALGAFGFAGRPTDEEEADSLEPAVGRQLSIVDVASKPDRRSIRLRLRAEDPTLPATGAAGDPTVHGATLSIRNPKTGEASIHSLRSRAWARREGSRVYVYSDPKRALGPCEKVIVSASGSIEALCRGAQIQLSLDESSQGSIAVELELGKKSHALGFCSLFGGKVSKDESTAKSAMARFRAVNAPAPKACS